MGVFLFISGFTVKFIIFPNLFEAAVYDTLELKNGTAGYNLLADPASANVTAYVRFR